MLSVQHRSTLLKGLAYGAGLAGLWLLLAALRPETTFHLASLLVAGTPPVVASLAERGLSVSHLIVVAVGGLLLALITAAIIVIAGRMEGPALEPFTDPVVEAVLLAVVGAMAGFAFGWWRTRVS